MDNELVKSLSNVISKMGGSTNDKESKSPETSSEDNSNTQTSKSSDSTESKANSTLRQSIINKSKGIQSGDTPRVAKQSVPGINENKSEKEVLIQIYRLIADKIKRDQQVEDSEKSASNSTPKDYQQSATAEKESADPHKNLDTFLKDPLKNIKNVIEDVVGVFRIFKGGLGKAVGMFGSLARYLPLITGGLAALLPALTSLLPILAGVGAVLGIAHLGKKAYDSLTTPRRQGYDVDADGSTRSGAEIGDTSKPGAGGTIKTWKDVNKDTSRPMNDYEFERERIPKTVGGESARKEGQSAESQPMTEEELMVKRSEPGKRLTKYDPNMPLSDVISIHESKGNYNIYNQGKGLKYKQGQTDFSKMTIDEVIRRQNLGSRDPNKLFATGRYQIIPDTLKEAKKSMKLSGNEMYSPEMQDKIFSEYLTTKKRPQIESFIKSGKGLDAAAVASAQEWASIGVASKGGKSWYSKDGINKAALTPEQIKKSLEVSRQRYQKAIAEGKSEKEAYRAATTGMGYESNSKETKIAEENKTVAEPSSKKVKGKSSDYTTGGGFGGEEPTATPASKDKKDSTKISSTGINSKDDYKGAYEYLKSKNSGDDIKNLDADYSVKLAAFMKDAEKQFGQKVTIASAFRAPTKDIKGQLGSVGSDQATLYKNAKDKSMVARPYHSMHDTGVAVDLSLGGRTLGKGGTMNKMSQEDLKKWYEIAKAHDLNIPMLRGKFGEGTGKKGSSVYETWHIEPGGVKRGGSSAYGLEGQEYADYIKGRSISRAAESGSPTVAAVWDDKNKKYTKEEDKTYLGKKHENAKMTSAEKEIPETSKTGGEEESEQEDTSEKIQKEPTSGDSLGGGKGEYAPYFEQMVSHLQSISQNTGGSSGEGSLEDIKQQAEKAISEGETSPENMMSKVFGSVFGNNPILDFLSKDSSFMTDQTTDKVNTNPTSKDIFGDLPTYNPTDFPMGNKMDPEVKKALKESDGNLLGNLDLGKYNPTMESSTPYGAMNLSPSGFGEQKKHGNIFNDIFSAVNQGQSTANQASRNIQTMKSVGKMVTNARGVGGILNAASTVGGMVSNIGGMFGGGFGNIIGGLSSELLGIGGEKNSKGISSLGIGEDSVGVKANQTAQEFGSQPINSSQQMSNGNIFNDIFSAVNQGQSAANQSSRNIETIKSVGKMVTNARGVGGILNAASTVGGMVSNIGGMFGGGGGNLGGSLGGIAGSAFGGPLGGTAGSMIGSGIQNLIEDESSPMGGSLGGLQGESDMLSSLGVTGFGGGMSNRASGGGGDSGGGDSGGQVGRKSGGGGGAKMGDARAGSSAGAMGIGIGVRNEESILQKSQYSVVRTV